MIGTAPSRAQATIEECVALGIGHVWFHRGPGAGSVDPDAARYGREHGISVIDGGCPCMFGPTGRPRPQDHAADPHAHRQRAAEGRGRHIVG